MKKFDKKKVFVGAVLLILSLGALAGCAGNTASAVANTEETETSSGDKTVIRVANFPFSVWNAQFIAAYQNGIFDEVFADDNISVEVVNFANGPAANEAFIAGDIDIVNGIGDQPIVIGIGNGVKTTIFSGAAKQGENIGIITSGDSDITSAEDLKNKKIGVFIGTYVHKSLIGILNDAGISEEDVEIVNITSTSDADAAFESGDIDAYLAMNADYIHVKVDEQNFKKIVDCSNHPAYSYIVVSDDFASAHQDLLEKFFEALYQAQEWIQENEEESYHVISEFSDYDVEQVKYINQDADITLEWDTDYEQNLIETYDFLYSHDMITNELTQEEILKHVNTAVIDSVTGK